VAGILLRNKRNYNRLAYSNLSNAVPRPHRHPRRGATRGRRLCESEDKSTAERLGERVEVIRARVEGAREIQRERFAVGAVREPPLRCNADMGPTEVRQICRLDEEGRALVKAAMQQLGMSARAFHRILKLARTIADLADSERIEMPHLTEAIQYRPRWTT